MFLIVLRMRVVWIWKIRLNAATRQAEERGEEGPAYAHISLSSHTHDEALPRCRLTGDCNTTGMVRRRQTQEERSGDGGGSGSDSDREGPH